MQFKDNDDPLADNFRHSDWMQAGREKLFFYFLLFASFGLIIANGGKDTRADDRTKNYMYFEIN